MNRRKVYIIDPSFDIKSNEVSISVIRDKFFINFGKIKDIVSVGSDESGIDFIHFNAAQQKYLFYIENEQKFMLFFMKYAERIKFNEICM
jgi:hypothetical protein